MEHVLTITPEIAYAFIWGNVIMVIAVIAIVVTAMNMRR